LSARKSLRRRPSGRSASVLENPHPEKRTPTRPYALCSSPPHEGHGPGGPEPMGWISSTALAQERHRYS
jgi:hypothetical protein